MADGNYRFQYGPIGGSAKYLEELKQRHEHMKCLVKDHINEAQQSKRGIMIKPIAPIKAIILSLENLFY